MTDATETIAADDVLARTVILSLGTQANSTNFALQQFTIGELIEHLLVFEVGPKDGTCMLSGYVTNGTTERKAINQDTNYLLMLDCDTGQPIEEVEARIQELGWL